MSIYVELLEEAKRQAVDRFEDNAIVVVFDAELKQLDNNEVTLILTKRRVFIYYGESWIEVRKESIKELGFIKDFEFEYNASCVGEKWSATIRNFHDQLSFFDRHTAIVANKEEIIDEFARSLKGYSED